MSQNICALVDLFWQGRCRGGKTKHSENEVRTLWWDIEIHLFFFLGISFVSENMGLFAQIKILLLKTFSSIWLWIITK